MKTNLQDAPTGTYLIFKLGNHFYGLPIPPVLLVTVRKEISPVAGSPGCIRGTITLNKSAIPVIDLLFCLYSEKMVLTEHNHIIVMENGIELEGYLVEELFEVVAVSEKMKLPLDREKIHEHCFLNGMARFNNQDVYLIDPSRLVSIWSHE